MGRINKEKAKKRKKHRIIYVKGFKRWYGECGRPFVGDLSGTTDWSEVTCNVCLRRKEC